jgi:ankyrin repeat protein
MKKIKNNLFSSLLTTATTLGLAICIQACTTCKGDNKESVTSITNEMVDAAAATLRGSGQKFMIDLLQKLKASEAADVNAKNTDDNDFTPLHYAAKIGSPSIIEALIERKADPNAKTSSTDLEKTPLMVAISEKKSGSVQALLKAPTIDVNAGDKNGKTALRYIVKHCFSACIQLLLDAKGIEVNKKSNANKTPLKRAEKKKKKVTLPSADKTKLEHIITALKSKGATT